MTNQNHTFLGRLSSFLGRAVVAAMLSFCLFVLPDRAKAHPHVFIDAGIELLFDDEGHLAAVRIVWVYDDFTSLLIAGERGLDPDGDGTLSAEERAELAGFDMSWVEGFDGDTYLSVSDISTPLGPPRDYSADYVQGRIVSTHLRALATPADPTSGPIVVQVYDPGYYSAYTIAAQPGIVGRTDCTAQVFAPDPAAGDAAFKAALEELSGTDLEMNFPAIGAAFAEEVRVLCADPS